MEENSLDILETREVLIAALKSLSSSGDYLNQLDQALGDGDHGSTIVRGSEAAMTGLRERTFTTVNQEFEAIGSSMMSSMGGASGILFGVLFRAAKNCPPSATLSSKVLASFLQRGLDDLKRKSAAAVGDKTMMDALVPAVLALEARQNETLEEALRAAAEAARAGAASTVGMLARFGRATALGERVRSAQDPGATSIAIFLESLTAAVKK